MYVCMYISNCYYAAVTLTINIRSMRVIIDLRINMCFARNSVCLHCFRACQLLLISIKLIRKCIQFSRNFICVSPSHKALIELKRETILKGYRCWRYVSFENVVINIINLVYIEINMTRSQKGNSLSFLLSMFHVIYKSNRIYS